MTEPDGKPKSLARRRHAARLAAVQALYQIEQTGAETDAESVILEFAEHRGGAVLAETMGDAAADLDQAHFADLVRGSSRRQVDIDKWLGQALVKGWPLTRLDAVLRAILRCGTYELWARGDVPAKVVISEYVDLADAFFGGDEVGMVNAVLDRIGRRLRQGDLAPLDPDPHDRNGTTG
ncbi:MAG: transcription antitermination factor NusB [Alphaproteobacteria bacterium]